jgi:hypothetical protein
MELRKVMENPKSSEKLPIRSKTFPTKQPINILANSPHK